MEAFGPYVSAQALMESVGDPFTYGVGQSLSDSSWKPFDTLELTARDSDKLYWVGRVSKGQTNFMASLARFFASANSDPEIYVQLKPPGGLAGDLNPSALREFGQGHTKAKVQQLITHTMNLGSPVTRFIVYFVGPSDATFKGIVEMADKHRKSDSPNMGQFVSNATRKYKAGKQILGWVEYAVTFGQDSYRGLEYRIDRQGWAVHSSVGVPDVVSAVSPSDFDKFGRSIGSKFSAQEATDLVTKHYVYKAWTTFRAFLDDTAHGPKGIVEKAIRDSRANLAKAKGVPLPKPGPAHNDKPPVYGKVVGSIKSDGNEMPYDVVSADEADHRVLRADGTYYQKNKPIDQRELHNVPAASVKPLIREDEYQAIFGIHYDHPMIKPGMNNQTWWYSDKNLLMSAAKTYALWTGDQPSIVFIATAKSGANKGVRVTWQELKNRSDTAGHNFRNEVNQLIARFRNNAAEGQRSFPALMMKYYGFDVAKAKLKRPDIGGLIDTPKNPLKDDPPEGFDREQWNKYVNKVRSVFKIKLGLNLGAGAVVKLTFDRSDIRKNVNATNLKKFAGEKGEKWALFLVQYLLAHGPSQTGASYTYMVPLNIIRSATANIKPLSLTRVRKDHLKQWMRDNHGKFAFFNKTQDWQFLKANLGMPFPYSRLIRPMVMTDQKKLKRINERLPQNIKMTTTGYVLDGVQYDAFTMVVAMPPSAAEAQGLVSRNKMARQVLADPHMVYRLRMGKKGKRGSLRELNLFSTPVAMVGAGVAHPDDVHKHDPVLTRARERMAGSDVMARAGFRGASEMTPSKLALSLGRRYAPLIKAHLNKAGNIIRISVAGYEASGTKEQRIAKWDEFIQNTQRESKDTELLINQVLNQMAQGAAALGRRPQGSVENEMHDNVQQFIRFVKMEVGNKGNTIRVPQLVHELKMSEFTAPVGSQNYRNLVLKMKAPSADVAKLLILYRLLRRSITNKQTGRLMTHRAFNRRTNMFPEFNAMLLAQWAAAGFPVVQNEDVRGLRVIQKPGKISKTDWEHSRAQKFGAHATARMLRVD